MVTVWPSKPGSDKGCVAITILEGPTILPGGSMAQDSNLQLNALRHLLDFSFLIKQQPQDAIG